jgi:aldehyde:ferredoxin oxidoreductase
MPIAEKFIGGRGLAAWIGWKEIPPAVDAFHPENRLIFMTGPLTGVLVPASGRLEVCGKAPQAYPKDHYTRSSMGGHWGPDLKYAGFDGIVIHGRSMSPVYIWIEDGEVEIKDAGRLWGLDTYETQKRLIERHGEGTQVCCIGPVGESLSRIAIIQSGVENAAGQGGFGAVMGSKNLKAIAVRGHGEVKVAQPERLIDLWDHVHKLRPPQPDAPPSHKACSMACATRCSMRVYRGSDGEVVAAHCCSPGVGLKPRKDGLKVLLLCDKYGLNRWEISWMGFREGSWFRRARETGEISDEEFGMPVDLEDPKFWLELLRKITYREGIGDALAEGMPRAAEILKKSIQHVPHVAHGYAAHWDGHLYGGPKYPHWLVSALMWALDTRDPIVHCYAQEISRWYGYGRGSLSIEEIERVSEKVYGSRLAVSLDSGYKYKAQPTIWHQHRDVIKDSLPVCDQMGFPLIYSELGYGDTSVEAKLFSAVTGIQKIEEELNRFGEMIINLERAIMVREGRTRRDDESIRPYFRRPDRNGVTLDNAKFAELLEEFYELRGWDKATGRPTREKLEELDLRDVADELEKLGLIG